MPPPSDPHLTLYLSSDSATPTKPTDIFTIPPLSPSTLFYLTHTIPHTSTFHIYGPVTIFPALIPRIESIVSNSPRAIDKLDALRYIVDVWGDSEENTEFQERGFERFVVEGQRGTYSVLAIKREINKNVFEELSSGQQGGLVYVVTKHGPLIMTKKGEKGMSEEGSSSIVGSFLDVGDAKDKARAVLKVWLKNEKDVKISEIWEKDGGGGGVVVGLGMGIRWEVKVRCEGRRG